MLKTAAVWDALAKYMARQGKDARALFTEFDTDGSETLSRTELKMALMSGPKINIDDDTFELVWRETDLSADGDVSFEEFQTAVRENRDKAQKVISGTWVPSARDKEKERMKKEADKLRNKQERAAKKGKSAKVVGTKQVQRKAKDALIERRAAHRASKALDKSISISAINYGRVRSIAMIVILMAVGQLIVSMQVRCAASRVCVRAHGAASALSHRVIMPYW